MLDYDQEAEQYDALRGGEPRAAAAAAAVLGLLPGGCRRLADVGCGTGIVTRRLAEARPDVRVTGVDRSAAMVRRAAARLPGAVVRADGRRLPFADERFDAVVSVWLLHLAPTDADARAVVAGVSAGSAPVEVYRGVVEGIALSYARIVSQLREVAPQPERLFAGGSVTTDHPELLQVMADAMRTPVTPVRIKRTTLHGTALLALESLAPDVRRARPDRGRALTPDYNRRRYYTDRFQRFERVYDALFG